MLLYLHSITRGDYVEFCRTASDMDVSIGYGYREYLLMVYRLRNDSRYKLSTMYRNAYHVH